MDHNNLFVCLSSNLTTNKKESMGRRILPRQINSHDPQNLFKIVDLLIIIVDVLVALPECLHKSKKGKIA